ncbi:preprotein translocase subunit SecG [Hyphococcus luteus]|uniref:Protein-export membrane protein SecG n=1 Tax=Hyphococcus luteus TaxID=2058213 RepID=A0A2S7JZ15_9PROT|nr:preprotein translocase subunit SecG [Marinicaulis flavus]PQA85456.1 preprotein translocase subunit SecG [Marinicaulis flavus]
MTVVILTIHSLIVLALIGVVLLQRSDGGALGLGGGGGGGGFMTGRGAANALTRTTAILAAAFFATSVVLAIRAGTGDNSDAVLDELTGAETQAPAEEPQSSGEMSTEDILNSLGAEDEAAPAPETTEDLLNAEGVDAPSANTEPAQEAPTGAADAPENAGEPQPGTDETTTDGPNR